MESGDVCTTLSSTPRLCPGTACSSLYATQLTLIMTSTWMDSFEEALKRVEDHAAEPVRSLNALRTICRNVANHPEEAKYRHIRLDK